MGDFNIDIKKENSSAYNKLEEFCDTFNLTNLVKTETCSMNNHKLTIDLILTKGAYIKYIGGGAGGFYKFFKKNS